MLDERTIGARFQLLAGRLDERGLRLWAAAEAESHGRGGTAAVARATGIAPSTIRRGRTELATGDSLFAALLGALSITGEIRHGTIRPTFLVTPRRHRIVAAKVWASMLVGAGFGLVAGAVAAGVGALALRARGIDVLLDAGDYSLLIAGGTAAAALWAAIGVGVGAVVRNQVPVLVGLCVWVLFVETLLVGDIAGVGDLGRLLPGNAGRAISGQDPDTLLAPAVGLVLLALYAAAVAAAGSLATSRRDIV